MYLYLNFLDLLKHHLIVPAAYEVALATSPLQVPTFFYVLFLSVKRKMRVHAP